MQNGQGKDVNVLTVCYFKRKIVSRFSALIIYWLLQEMLKKKEIGVIDKVILLLENQYWQENLKGHNFSSPFILAML